MEYVVDTREEAPLSPEEMIKEAGIDVKGRPSYVAVDGVVTFDLPGVDSLTQEQQDTLRYLVENKLKIRKRTVQEKPSSDDSSGGGIGVGVGVGVGVKPRQR